MAPVNYNASIDEAVSEHLYVYVKNCQGYNLHFFSALKAFNALTPAL